MVAHTHILNILAGTCCHNAFGVISGAPILVSLYTIKDAYYAVYPIRYAFAAH
jgi:hypothetical protein